MKKRIFAIFTAAALAVSVMTALAEYDPNKVVAENEIATKTVAAPIITVNGTEIDAPDYFMKDETLMLPLRAITEALGFEIEWQGETGTIILTRGPLYITMSAFADGYTFSKTAPMSLGTAPILTEGTTFVPENFITEILDGAYAIDEAGNIKIVWGDMKDVALITGLNGEEKQITVTDIIKGEVVLNVGGETHITDEAGTPVAFEDLKEGMTVKIFYGDMMTRSIPPQNVPNSVVVLAGSPAATLPSFEEVEEVAEEKITITAIDTDANTVTVADSVRGEVVLVLGEKTAISDAEGKTITIADLKADMTVSVEYGDAMTMSLPPINNPKSIKVVAEKGDVQILPVETEAPADK